MGLVSRIGNAIDALRGASAFIHGRMFNDTIYGQLQNTEAFITDAYQKNADLYSIVSFIASKVSVAPFTLYEVKDEKMLRKYNGLTSNPTFESLQSANFIKTKALNEVGSNHPLLKILNNTPNNNMNGGEFKFACAVYRLLTGNTYIYGLAPDSAPEKFVELHILPSQFTNPVSGGQYMPVKGYKLDFLPDPKDLLPKENVAHYRYFNPDFTIGNPHIVGQSPLQAASNLILRSNSGFEASTKAFQNGGLTGVLYEDGGVSLTEAQRMQLQNHIDDKMTGPGKFKQIVAASSKLGWLQIGSSPVDLGILQSIATDLRSMCNIYHLPSQLFNDPEGKTYMNMGEARKVALTDAILPELTALRDALNQWLIPGWNKADKKTYYLDFDLSVYAEMQADMKSASEWLDKCWWITPNEKRQQQDYDVLGKEFDEPFVPAGLMPLSQASVPIDFQKAFETVGLLDYDH